MVAGAWAVLCLMGRKLRGVLEAVGGNKVWPQRVYVSGDVYDVEG